LRLRLESYGIAAALLWVALPLSAGDDVAASSPADVPAVREEPALAEAAELEARDDETVGLRLTAERDPRALGALADRQRLADT